MIGAPSFAGHLLERWDLGPVLSTIVLSQCFLPPYFGGGRLLRFSIERHVKLPPGFCLWRSRGAGRQAEVLAAELRPRAARRRLCRVASACCTLLNVSLSLQAGFSIVGRRNKRAHAFSAFRKVEKFAAPCSTQIGDKPLSQAATSWSGRPNPLPHLHLLMDLDARLRAHLSHLLFRLAITSFVAAVGDQPWCGRCTRCSNCMGVGLMVLGYVCVDAILGHDFDHRGRDRAHHHFHVAGMVIVFDPPPLRTLCRSQSRRCT